MIANKQSAKLISVFKLLLFSSLLTHALSLIQTAQAGSSTSSSSNEAVSSASQPLWSYQVKPGNQGASPSGYLASQLAGAHHYPSAGSPLPSIFEAFNGALTQRQGALTSSPFLSILPIILIAAGGMLLLLPLLTMMMASPFGGFGAGFNNNAFGYPQAGLNKRRSLTDQLGKSSSFYDILEHVSSTIDDLSKKYSQSNSSSRRFKASSTNHQATQSTSADQQASKPTTQLPSPTDSTTAADRENSEPTIVSNGSASSLNLISSLRS